MSDTLVYFKGKNTSLQLAYEAAHAFQEWKTKEEVTSVLCCARISQHIYFPSFVSCLEEEDFFLFDKKQQSKAYEKALEALENMQELKSI